MSGMYPCYFSLSEPMLYEIIYVYFSVYIGLNCHSQRILDSLLLDHSLSKKRIPQTKNTNQQVMLQFVITPE